MPHILQDEHREEGEKQLRRILTLNRKLIQEGGFTSVSEEQCREIGSPCPLTHIVVLEGHPMVQVLENMLETLGIQNQSDLLYKLRLSQFREGANAMGVGSEDEIGQLAQGNKSGSYYDYLVTTEDFQKLQRALFPPLQSGQLPRDSGGGRGL